MDSDDDLIDRAQSLSDLELAVLLSLVGNEHCVIGTPDYAVDDLVDELCLVASNIFGLRCVVINFHEQTTFEDFASSLMVPKQRAAGTSNGLGSSGHHSHESRLSPDAPSAHGAGQPSLSPGLRSPRAPGLFSAKTSASAASGSTSASATPSVMANLVLARNLNRAPKAVQIQALELLRTRRIFTHTAMQAAPKTFLFVPVVAAERGFRWEGPDKIGHRHGHHHKNGKHTSNGKAKSPPDAVSPHMTGHLNDIFAMAHWHDPEDGYPNLDDEDDRARLDDDDNDKSDSESIVRQSTVGRSRSGSSSDTPSLSLGTFSEADIRRLGTLASAVRVDTDVLRYTANIVAFLRLHRAVAVLGDSSVSPTATRHFEQLSKRLAPLHRLDYVTPSLVALAARKVYLHRIRTVAATATGSDAHGRPGELPERSMQWGSERAAVEAELDGVSPESVIENVLGAVPPPI